ncbi:hypothetical protein RchiOBHm_Chr6g0250731 [Rosa chinensis]|uniref:Uncharacterized protein n=1 Tax=Rosa chinensis TaxID=74649 RepID=A0A2P6PKL5_ROSCH|nr:hypothetical protein RchiOBHm_Chr6g0250731 [Rosa chinensis]
MLRMQSFAFSCWRNFGLFESTLCPAPTLFQSLRNRRVPALFRPLNRQTQGFQSQNQFVLKVRGFEHHS